MCEPRLAVPSASSQMVSGDQSQTLDASRHRTMSLSTPSYRDGIEDTCLLLEENFRTLYQHCSTPEQKRQLSETHSAARYAWWKVGKQARPGESSVDSRASQDLKMVNVQLAAVLKDLGDIGAFLSLAAEAVRLAELLAP